MSTAAENEARAKAARVARELSVDMTALLGPSAVLEVNNLLAEAYLRGLVDGYDASEGVSAESLRNLASYWRGKAWGRIPDAYTDRGLSAKYLNGDNGAAGMSDCAEELDEMLDELFSQ